MFENFCSEFEFWSCLGEWQPLAAGLVALFAALLTVRAIRCQSKKQSADVTRQINASKEEAEERRVRSFRAARAVLPADLSSLSLYIRNCAFVCGQALQMVRKEIPKDKLETPVLPERVLDDLKELIDALEKHDAEALAEVIKYYQIQHSRILDGLDEFNNPDTYDGHTISTPQNIEFLFEKTIQLQMLVDNIYDFSRQNQDRIPERKFCPDDVYSKINTLRLNNILTLEHQYRLGQLFSENSE